jgi:hypothetical protein
MCPRCKSERIIRSRRRGIRDYLWGRVGLWPYHCKDCGRRFRLPVRHYPTRSDTARAPVTRAPEAKPNLAFRTHPSIPLAKVLLRAESQEQLEQMLIRIERTVGSYQHLSK